jgi:hypothetical protein
MGEITSTIDPEVQGRVSRVIIRVGNQPLPRRTPPLPSSAQTSSYNQFQSNDRNSGRTNASTTVAAVDLVPVPIPEMTNHRDVIPIPAGPGGAGDFGASTSASVMKPDPASPQGGGFSLPDSLKNVANGLKESSRETIEKLQQNMGAGAPNPFATNQLDSAMNQLRQQGTATNNAIDQISQAGRSTSAMQGPSTDPVSPSTSRVQPPSFTNSADAAGAYARARANGPSTDPTTNRSAAWSPIGEARNDAAAPPTTTGGFGATGNFAQQPESLRSPTNTGFTGAANTPIENPFASAATSRSTAIAQEPEVDPRLSAAQRAALPPGAYSFDLDGFPVDRNWRRIDSPSSNFASNVQAANGLGTANSVAPTYQNQTAFPGNTSQNWTGSAASAIGQPSSVGSLSGSPAFGPIAANPSSIYQNQTPYAAPAYSATQVTESDINAAADRIARERIAAAERLAANNNSFSGVPSQLSNLNRPTPHQDGFPSSSDNAPSSSAGAGQTSSGAKSTVAAQKLFNVMLLCSIVGNIYLFFWLKNMRDQFRDLVTAKRMSQSSVAA